MEKKKRISIANKTVTIRLGGEREIRIPAAILLAALVIIAIGGYFIFCLSFEIKIGDLKCGSRPVPVKANFSR